jgi:hypothetical protein
MGLLVPAVPAHRDPHAEDEIARHVQEEHEQEPPDLHLEIDGFILYVDPDEVERDAQDQQHDGRDVLEEHEQQHGGHPTAGVAA